MELALVWAEKYILRGSILLSTFSLFNKFSESADFPVPEFPVKNTLFWCLKWFSIKLDILIESTVGIRMSQNDLFSIEYFSILF